MFYKHIIKDALDFITHHQICIKGGHFFNSKILRIKIKSLFKPGLFKNFPVMKCIKQKRKKWYFFCYVGLSSYLYVLKSVALSRGPDTYIRFTCQGSHNDRASYTAGPTLSLSIPRLSFSISRRLILMHVYIHHCFHKQTNNIKSPYQPSSFLLISFHAICLSFNIHPLIYFSNYTSPKEKMS